MAARLVPVLTSVVATGCVGSMSMRAANVTVPVLLGPVHHLGAPGSQASGPGHSSGSCAQVDVEGVDDYSIVIGSQMTTERRLREGAGKYDVVLGAAVEQASAPSSAHFHVDAVKLGSWVGGTLLFAWWYQAWVELETSLCTEDTEATP